MEALYLGSQACLGSPEELGSLLKMVIQWVRGMVWPLEFLKGPPGDLIVQTHPTGGRGPQDGMRKASTGFMKL